MDDWKKDIIAGLAQSIREQLKGMNLYGEPLDLDDPDACLVAAWSVGYDKGSYEAMQGEDL